MPNKSNLHSLQILVKFTKIIFLGNDFDRLLGPLYHPFADIDLQFSRQSFEFPKVLFAF